MTHVWSIICSIFTYVLTHFPDGSDGKESDCNETDPDSISWLGRFPGEGSDSLLQYSCLENSMDRGDWRAIVYGAAKSQTQLRD